MAVTLESIRKKNAVKTKEDKESEDMALSQGRQKYRSLKEFNDFTNVTHAFMFEISIDELYVNKVDVAREIIRTQEPNPLYSDTYHIALRKGEFHAQVDKCLSEIYQLFLGYGPGASIVKEGNTFYLASRTIRNFMHGFENYYLVPQGIFKKSNSEKMTLKGLASIVAIGYFFGETDIHFRNWGIQEQENGNILLAYKIDCADGLNCSVLSTLITKEDIQLLAKKCLYFVEPSADGDEHEEHSFGISPFIIDSPEFQSELAAMLVLIAEIDFDQIRQILIRNISTNESYSAMWMFEKMQYLIAQGPEKLSEKTSKSFEECVQLLEEVRENCLTINDIVKKLEKEENHDVNFILVLLERRQLALRAVMGTNPIIAPTISDTSSVASNLANNLLAVQNALSLSDVRTNHEIENEPNPTFVLHQQKQSYSPQSQAISGQPVAKSKCQ